ncbi:MAG: thiopurine S-methyltransferase [Acidobacteriaceae bacterium]|nr:thiopurine S-methyltransferase [Acidobacteriaceae bacterium]
MEEQFWKQKWQDNEIFFHEGQPNHLMLRHIGSLALHPGARVFVPLCGKSYDLHWLRQQGYDVVGAELSQIAIDQLFEELNLQPTIEPIGALLRYTAPGMTIFVGSIFALDAATLGPIDAIYDRAAMVALPKPLREQYIAHLDTLAASAPRLLITFTYDQTLQAGPPFSLDEQLIHHDLGTAHKLTLLETADVPGGLKVKCPATESAWLVESH